MKEFESVSDFAGHKGKEIGVSDWVMLDQGRIDRFADATGDHQWIHIDAKRCKEEMDMPTIAHGFLTLSLLPELMGQTYRVKSVKRGINYGTNRVRFTNMVPSGSRVRARAVLKDHEPKAGGTMFVNEVTMEIEGQERPAMVAETITILYE